MRLEEVPMVCISLDRRPDRWAAFQRYARKADIEVQKLPAVDSKTFDVVKHPGITLGVAHNIKHKIRRSHYEIDAAGAIGCSLSHFKAWEMLRASSSPAMIIFEDDAPVPADFKARLAKVMADLPAGWDMVQFQMTTYGPGVNGCKPIQGQEPWQFCTALMGSYAYMISQRGAERMLERAYPIELHMDAYMAYMSRMGHIRMLWHPLIDIPGPIADSDIAHGNQGVLAVPTDMRKHGIIAIKKRGVWGLVTMAAIVGGLLALAYAVPLRRR
jgi:glycosyl transferase family 25